MSKHYFEERVTKSLDVFLVESSNKLSWCKTLINSVKTYRTLNQFGLFVKLITIVTFKMAGF